MRFVALIRIGNTDDEHIGFDLDDAGDHMLEVVDQNRATLRARLPARNTPQFLLPYRGDQHRAVGTDGEILQEVLFRKVGNRSQSDCGKRGYWHDIVVSCGGLEMVQELQ